MSKSLVVYFHKDEPKVFAPSPNKILVTYIDGFGVLIVAQQPTDMALGLHVREVLQGFNQGIWKSFKFFDPDQNGGP